MCAVERTANERVMNIITGFSREREREGEKLDHVKVVNATMCISIVLCNTFAACHSTETYHNMFDRAYFHCSVPHHSGAFSVERFLAFVKTSITYIWQTLNVIYIYTYIYSGFTLCMSKYNSIYEWVHIVLQCTHKHLRCPSAIAPIYKFSPEIMNASGAGWLAGWLAKSFRTENQR